MGGGSGMRYAAGLAMLMGCFWMKGARAINPETLLMPGKMSAAHQKYEEQCSQCHDRADRKRQTQLCLGCHKDIAADVAGQRGFHGRLPGIDGAECRACHSEHLGREADIVKLSREQFDHRLTQFPLQGAHAALACGSCHHPGKRFRDAPTDCNACHRKDDAHAGTLGKDCAACHTVKAWPLASFDHSRTAFALSGKHAQAACVQCHFGNRYHDTPRLCVSCHAPDDVHRGERGVRCADCHATSAWKTAKFDHAKQTGFALAGAHAALACGACHHSDSFEDKLPRDCAGCHRGEDPHTGRFGQACERCHGSERWRPATFDHARDTRWPLAGGHGKVDCHACHRPAVDPRKVAQDCIACHRKSDVHSGKLGEDCARCHTPEGWRRQLSFDHDLTAFPLVGLHVTVPCGQCHATRAYRPAPHECVDCHRVDDAHKGGLGKECGRCHSPNGWRIWQFDHGKETGFALSGAHGKLECASCHKQPAGQVKLDSTCTACHTKDDVHLGQFGRQCARCHSTVSFKGARLH